MQHLLEDYCLIFSLMLVFLLRFAHLPLSYSKDLLTTLISFMIRTSVLWLQGGFLLKERHDMPRKRPIEVRKLEAEDKLDRIKLEESITVLRSKLASRRPRRRKRR